LAWLANTARIVTITAAAITWGRDFAMGMFHTWGALLVLFLMFAACCAAFQWQANFIARRA
jgi:exosortase/archaeosortase family protein